MSQLFKSMFKFNAYRYKEITITTKQVVIDKCRYLNTKYITRPETILIIKCIVSEVTYIMYIMINCTMLYCNSMLNYFLYGIRGNLYNVYYV